MWGSMSVVIAFASLGEKGGGEEEPRKTTWSETSLSITFLFFLFLLFISLFITPLLELLFNKY